MAVFGASAGGIFVGRVVTERPDLFAAAVIMVPIADTLRYEFTANGAPNVTEFGSVRTKAGFHALYEMSSYAHVRDGVRYPAIFLETGINDARVDPWQPGKLAARFQAATSSGKPVLLRVDYDAGHSPVTMTMKQAAEVYVDFESFVLWQTGDPEFQPKKN